MKELAQCVEKIKNIVNSIDESTFEKRYKILLDCADLPILSLGDQRDYFAKLPNFFGALNVARQPAIYWFVITSSHTAKQVMNTIKKANENVKRKFPLLNTQRAYKSDSKVLYVGKTWSELKSRMISHLGYHKNSDNHGLQLCHWAVELELKLELNYISLPQELEGLTELFERELSKQLKPIIGRQA